MLRNVLVAAVVVVLGVAQSAEALVIDASLDARLCVDPACNTVTMTSPRSEPMVGTFDVNWTTLEFDFHGLTPWVVLRGIDGSEFELGTVRVWASGTLGGPFTHSGPSIPILGGTGRTGGATAATVSGVCGGGALRGACVLELGGLVEEDHYLALKVYAYVPEPETILLLAVGLVLVGCRRSGGRRSARSAQRHQQSERASE